MPSQTAHLRLSTTFLHWYYVQRPVAILKLYRAYMQAFLSAFSFAYLLRTLFAPWKAIRDAYPTKGLNIERILETLTLNVTARAIGFVIRIGAMLCGVVIQIVLLVGFITYFVVWMMFPLLLILLIPYIVAVSFA